MTDLVLLCRSRTKRIPSRESLAGLGAAWRAAEGALLAECSASPRKARRLLDRFTALATRSGEREAIGRAARLRASIAALRGRWADANREYRAAASRLDGVAAASARMGRAGVLVKMGRFATARAEADAARRAAVKLGEPMLAAAATATSALALHEGGDPRRAVPLYEKALAAFRGAGQTAHAAHCMRNLANALTLTDRFADAAPLYEAAATAFESLGAARDAALARYNRGALFVAIDRLSDAESDLLAAEASLRAAGYPHDAAMARIDRGEALFRANLYAEARHAVESGLRAGGRSLAAADRVRGTVILARTCAALGDADASRRTAARVPAAVPERLELLALADLAAFRWARSSRGFERAAIRFGSSRPTAQARCFAAAAWNAWNDPRAPRRIAERRANRLAQAAQRAAARAGTPSARFAASAVRFSIGAEPRLQAKSLRDAFAALGDIVSGTRRDALRSLAMIGHEDWMSEAIEFVAQHDGPDAAVALVERWRAAGLRDLLAKKVRGSPSEKARALRERLSRMERAEDDASFPPFLRTAAAAVAPRRLAREIARAERDLRDVLDRDATADAAQAVPDDVAGVAAAALDERTAVLVPLGDRSVAVLRRGRTCIAARSTWWVRRRGDLRELRFRIGATAHGADFERRHAARISAAAAAALDRLSTGLIGDLAPHLAGTDRLVLVPDGLWTQVPCAALRLGGRALCETHAVSLAPSLTGPVAPPATGRDIVVAFADDRAPLIDAEARAAAAAMPGALVLSGRDARLDRLRDALAAGPPRCLHVAAHGRFRADAPEMSGVLLADGWLRAVEWADLPLAGTTVVLSGCDTGAAPSRGGEVLGLVRGVLAAGARDVILSLWKVGDAAAASLMNAFHVHRASGLGAAESLARAQRDALRNGAPVADWAGYVSWSARP